MAESGSIPVFTQAMAAGETISITRSSSISYVSVLCLTDNSGSNGVTITGTAKLGGTSSNAITLTANQSITVSAPEPYQLDTLTIVTGTGSTATLIAV